MTTFNKVEVMRMSSRSKTFIIRGDDPCCVNDDAYEVAQNTDYTGASENGVEYEITSTEECDAHGHTI